MLMLGTLFLGLGLLLAVASAVMLAWGHQLGADGGRAITDKGYLTTFAAAGSLTMSVLVMILAFFNEDFSLMYVVENHPTDVSNLAWLYKLSGIWAGREGSLLFWAWLVSLFGAWIAYKRMGKLDAVSNIGLAVTNVVLALFGAAMMLSEPNNPYKATPAEWLGPNGELLVDAAMNPLLQHWAMILHPPTLFIGYAGLTIPFAFAIAALIVNDPSKRWVEIVDRITVFSWIFLGAGIGLGSVWAYVVLGWGGYWAWDPVENASFLPWLTTVGLVHTFTVYRRRGSFKRWAIIMAAVSFSFVILGTFITRSGIVQSVHAFERDPVSLYLFGFMIVAPVAAAAIGLRFRWKDFAGDDEFQSLTSKEAAYYFNNVIMLIAAILVAYMTVSSALPLWLPMGGRSFGVVAFDLVGRPLGIIYAFLIAVCPMLSWRLTDKSTFVQRVKWPLAGTAILVGLLVFEWFTTLRPIYDATIAAGGKAAADLTAWGPSMVYHGIALLGFIAGALLISTNTWLFFKGITGRAAARSVSLVVATGEILTKTRRQAGGYLAHIGMGLIIIGLVGSSMFVLDTTQLVNDEPGSAFTVSDYEFIYEGTEESQLANGDVVSAATFRVVRNGADAGTVAPGIRQFALQGQTNRDAAVLSEPLRDIFVVWEGSQSGQLSMNVKVNPLIGFAWGGFALLLVGTTLAAWPSARSPE
jgi:cytochrome c-type biogenesis protein CcmF